MVATHGVDAFALVALITLLNIVQLQFLKHQRIKEPKKNLFENRCSVQPLLK